LDENTHILVPQSFRTLNEEKFDELYLHYYPSMLAYASNFVLPDDAEEVVQDVMVWLWENRKTVVIRTTLKGYLFRAVRNSCMTRITQGQAQQRLRQAIFDRIQPFYEDADNYTSEILVIKIEEALNRLPESYRITFRKSRFEDKTYSEIAVELGVSVKTVEYRMTQALKQLRIELKEYLPVAAVVMLLTS
jgi:RNA polymerase sigma-70 factor (family 1)